MMIIYRQSGKFLLTRPAQKYLNLPMMKDLNYYLSEKSPLAAISADLENGIVFSSPINAT